MLCSQVAAYCSCMLGCNTCTALHSVKREDASLRQRAIRKILCIIHGFQFVKREDASLRESYPFCNCVLNTVCRIMASHGFLRCQWPNVTPHNFAMCSVPAQVHLHGCGAKWWRVLATLASNLASDLLLERGAKTSG